MRARTRTWRVGGILLAVAGVLTLVGGQYVLDPFAMRITVDLFWATGIAVLAWGLSRDASVVARRPLGMTALAVVALTPLVVDTILLVLPDPVSASDPSVAAVSGLVWTGTFVSTAAAFVAAAQIARLGAVPRRWRWTPMWALGLSLGAAVLQYAVVALLVQTGAGQDALVPTTLLGVVAALVPTLGLGIAALLAAAGERPESVDVYRPV